MRMNDATAGVVFLLFAVALAIGAWGLPNPSEQIFGPSTFPLVIASLLGVCSVILVFSGLRSPSQGPYFVRSEWTYDPWMVFRFLLVPAAIATYVTFVEAVGFLPTAMVILFSLFLSGHVRPLRAAILSICIAFLIHTIFYVGLSVQLPWGVMDPVRW